MNWFGRLKERQQRYQQVFAGEDGEWVLADIINRAGYGQDPQTKGDPYQTSYLVGREIVAKDILRILGMSWMELNRIAKQYEEAEARKDEGIFRNE